MKRVTWSESAIRDLRRIQDHLSQFHSDIGQATVERLILTARWLLNTPGAGPIVGYRRWRKWRVPKTRYLLIYEPTAAGITVVRCFHAQQDWRAVVD